ncbi:LOW QUALITY PROTEIN: hypothetical protein V1477_005705 [Vespula maculifrons]|uniref:Uncharacterized protein n=1 Tax=Vespula maculifrons TaxID=7453 RepID=A0ABD2CLR4_VESMC
MEACFISDVDCLMITLSVVEIHVSSSDLRHRRSIVHLNCIKGKSGYALLSHIKYLLRKATK